MKSNNIYLHFFSLKCTFYQKPPKILNSSTNSFAEVMCAVCKAKTTRKTNFDNNYDLCTFAIE